MRMEALKTAAILSLPDWCIAAGFVRNLVWDKLHDYGDPTPLNDIDLVYFNPQHVSAEKDAEIEQHLKSITGWPWSVKNQARMHLKNKDKPYLSSADAMTYWVEEQAAIGATLTHDNEVKIIAPFGLDIFFNYSITMNLKRPKPDAFKKRVANKGWLEKWPKLKAVR